MKYVLWVLQVVLALMFLGAGFAKLTQPYDTLAAQPQMAWVSALPELLVRFIGLAEVLGAIGLILPAATRILPWLTPLAAAALSLVMVLAVLFHLTRGELPAVIPTLVLAVLAGFVAYGRRTLVPIQPRGAAATPALA